MLLEIEGLTKHFGGLAAVNQFGMYVNQGEIVGLIGPNGTGKTTVFNLHLMNTLSIYIFVGDRLDFSFLEMTKAKRLEELLTVAAVPH